MPPEKAAARDLRALGRALRCRRKAHGLTQKELANRVGLDDPTFISRIERGRRDPQWLTLRRLLRALEMNLHRLADAIEQEERNEATS
jgi:transcriptional regulator with XRE-family HTH domain